MSGAEPKRAKRGLGEAFEAFAKRTSRTTGHAGTFIAACLVIAVWAITGPLFGFSDTWQLVINTSTTIVTFLMVFLIQNTQNRDMEALQIKVDELVRALPRAKNRLLDLEELPEEHLHALQEEYHVLARRARREPLHGDPKPGDPLHGRRVRRPSGRSRPHGAQGSRRTKAAPMARAGKRRA